MSNMAPKSWSTEEKVAIVLSVLRGELSMSEASRRYGVSNGQSPGAREQASEL
jgi:transposase-like protein